MKMKTKTKIFAFLITLLLTQQVLGQTTYSNCTIDDVYSQNGEFYIQTIPFDNIEQTTTGKSIVCKSDKTLLYEIPRHFENSYDRMIFLSNDGKTIVYIQNREYYWKGVNYNCIEIYKNGFLFKQFKLNDLITCDSNNEDCFLFYNGAIDSVKWKSGKKEIVYKKTATNLEKTATEKPIFINNDTIYIFTKTNEIVKIDLTTTKITKSVFSEISEEWLKSIKPIKFEYEEFKASSLYGLPNLSNGNPIEKGIANEFNMSIFPEFKKNSDKYKRYSIKIQIIVDTNGNAVIDEIENYSDLSEEKIKSFIESHKFETNSIPIVTEKWRFDGWIELMNKSKRLSKKEKKIEEIKEDEAYKKRIIADTIEGIYIPKNLEECFIQLDKILKPKDIETIKNLKSKDDMSNYHFGLGLWIRNNWGLWGGSRLQIYFFNKGVNHPDNMSGIILEYYYEWLHNENENWKNFENK